MTWVRVRTALPCCLSLLALFGCECARPGGDVNFPSCQDNAGCAQRPGTECCEIAEATGRYCVDPNQCVRDAGVDAGSDAGSPTDGGPTCGPGTWGGCCELDGGRAPGDQATSCGFLGSVCQRCPSGQTCEGGRCSGCLSCGDGCCVDGLCNARSVAQCGTGGELCTDCTNRVGADNCNASGQCVCGTGTTPCEAGQKCAQGVCVCDSTSCSGCCDTSGKCLPNTLGACASGGAACRVCDSTQADTCTGGECRCGQSPGCATGQRCLAGVCVCDAQTCPNGCCDSAKQCQSGQAPAACGKAGGNCQTCPGPCTNGLCGGCDVSTCPAGCCFNGLCQMPRTVAQCGAAGMACTACGPTSDTCGDGVCKCGNGNACAAGQVCVNGSCQCTPASCPSGCCSGTQCISPTTAASCGADAGACISCGIDSDTCAQGACRCGNGPRCNPGQQCVSGQCKCNPTSCPNDCCTSDVCVIQPNPLCGVGGAACVQCSTLLTDTCHGDGSCGCGMGAPCPAGNRCMAGICLCDKNTCVGCCGPQVDGGTQCLPGNLMASCGNGGDDCLDCGAGNRGDACTAKSCRCGGGAICAVGHVCTLNLCL